MANGIEQKTLLVKKKKKGWITKGSYLDRHGNVYAVYIRRKK